MNSIEIYQALLRENPRDLHQSVSCLLNWDNPLGSDPQLSANLYKRISRDMPMLQKFSSTQELQPDSALPPKFVYNCIRLITTRGTISWAMVRILLLQLLPKVVSSFSNEEWLGFVSDILSKPIYNSLSPRLLRYIEECIKLTVLRLNGCIDASLQYKYYIVVFNLLDFWLFNTICAFDNLILFKRPNQFYFLSPVKEWPNSY